MVDVRRPLSYGHAASDALVAVALQDSASGAAPYLFRLPALRHNENLALPCLTSPHLAVPCHAVPDRTRPHLATSRQVNSCAACSLIIACADVESLYPEASEADASAVADTRQHPRIAHRRFHLAA